jgi:nitroreductase
MIMRKGITAALSISLLLSAGLFLARAQEPKVIKLPEPQTDGGRPLMQVLKARQTAREFSPETKLPAQVLANLLWAADGINRPDGKRTAPSAVNWQNIDIYVATADGLYLYDAPHNALKGLLAQDVRGATGAQAFVKSVPLNLVYVADYSKAKTATGSENPNTDTWSAAGVGFISQNVYLYCASEGLATVVRGMFDREALGKVLKLRADQKIILTQSVGYPKK